MKDLIKEDNRIYKNNKSRKCVSFAFCDGQHKKEKCNKVHNG